MDRELMQQALHTLEGWANYGKWVWPESALEQAKRNTTESIAALRERLAQPVQEPVKFKCTVIDDANPNGVPLSQWGRHPGQGNVVRNMIFDGMAPSVARNLPPV